MLRNFFNHLEELINELITKEETWFLLFVLLFGSGLIIFLPYFGLRDLFEKIVWFLKETNWLWSFLILFFSFKSLWLYWRRAIFKRKIDFILLELKMPREAEKEPRGMEQILAALNALRNTPTNFKEKYWDGEVTRWFSLEMVSFGGDIHFYLRVFKKQQKIVEAAFFSYYPDVEIFLVDDYIDKLPKNIFEVNENGCDLWGAEVELSRDSAYPIKTYPAFEQIAEERQFDPISNFLEVLGNAKPGEFVGIQILIAPANYDWFKKWEKVVDKLKASARMAAAPAIGTEEEISTMFTILSPGQRLVLEAVEKKLSKQAFDTLIRYIYISPKEIINKDYASRGIFGLFNQYAAYDMNSFKPNLAMWTSSSSTTPWKPPFVFSKSRLKCRKQRILWNYLKREMPPDTRLGRIITSSFYHKNATRLFEMNTEEVATIFHPPTPAVMTGPHLERAESKKTGPPAGTAIFGEEEELAKYL